MEVFCSEKIVPEVRDYVHVLAWYCFVRHFNATLLTMLER